MMRQAACRACTLLLLLASTAAAQTAGFDPNRLRRLDPLIERAIKERLLPGAVVLVGRGDEIVSVKAYGHRALEPSREPMTPDTIFDIASLTKVVASTTSVMMLVEEGRLRLNDRVSTHIPGFGRYGKEDVTIRHLLTHVAGLRPDVDLALDWRGREKAIELAVGEVPVARPGERFVYSDIGFFLLGEIVARVSGEPLEVFARRRIFEPLGMKDTMFLPPRALAPRIAPTERCDAYAWPCDNPRAPMLRGVVHDPTARRMGGVAGHAGVFSTAADLAVFCRMLLRGGEVNGVRILSPLTVARTIAPSSPAGHLSTRGLGWDIDTAFSANRGELLPVGSFGHTGFTGTSLWIDPVTQVFVVFLSNRLHPDGKGDVTPLRARVATMVAAALTEAPPLADLQRQTLAGADFGPGPPSPAASEPGRVLTGIDVLRAEEFARLKGKRVGLVTNTAARAADGMSTLEVVAAAPAVKLVALFSPEHGLSAAADTEVASSLHERTGLMVRSLYGKAQRPDPAALEGLDAILVDLPDVGARFYTYMTTLGYVMEEAAKKKVPVVVLDRPNPINGYQIEGPVLDADIEHFAAYFSMPIRHGLTIGELAAAFNAEKKIGAALSVVQVKGWSRDSWFDETGLPWANPSPNMRNLHQAALYPGLGAIEWANISVGRGTDQPFEQIGAPWIDGRRLATALNARRIPGVRFYPVGFTPSTSVYAGEGCAGVFILITDRSALRPVRVGVEIASALHRLHPEQFDFKNTVRLLGSQSTIDRIRKGDDPASIAAAWNAAEAEWRLRRGKYLLY